jgi:hypothetical protein
MASPIEVSIFSASKQYSTQAMARSFKALKQMTIIMIFRLNFTVQTSGVG